MFIGHFAVAFGMKRVAPEVNLGTAILAVTFLDVIWPLLVATGIEVVRIDPGSPFSHLRFVSYPFSHSLAMAIVWGTAFAAVYRWRGGARHGALWLALAVISHWFLDLIVHQPDLQVLPEVDVYVGLGLWNSLPATLAVEGLLFAGGLGLYLSSTRASDHIGRWAVWGLVALLLVSYVAAVFSAPPDVTAIVIADIVGTTVAVLLGGWADLHRQPITNR